MSDVSFLEKALSYQIGQNTLLNFFLALVCFLTISFLFRFFRNFLLERLKKMAKKTKNDFDDFVITTLKGVSLTFYRVIGFYAALKYLKFTPEIDKIINGAFIIIVVFQGIIIAQKFFEYSLLKWAERSEGGMKKNATAVNAIKMVGKMVLWVLGVLLVLSNLGFNVSTLIASFGIGGVAVAFALQNILSDLFSSFTIYFDKPFEIGDSITIGQHRGTVKKIGLKSTRIETLQGEELVVSNNELTTTRIQNFKKMTKRRISFSLGVTYDTTSTQLKKIPKIIEKILSKIEVAELNRVHFSTFGDFSLQFDIVYYLNSKDYAVYMDTQQQINLEIKEQFEKEKIEMAFPTQTIYVEKQGK